MSKPNQIDVNSEEYKLFLKFQQSMAQSAKPDKEQVIELKIEDVPPEMEVQDLAASSANLDLSVVTAASDPSDEPKSLEDAQREFFAQRDRLEQQAKERSLAQLEREGQAKGRSYAVAAMENQHKISKPTVPEHKQYEVVQVRKPRKEGTQKRSDDRERAKTRFVTYEQFKKMADKVNKLSRACMIYGINVCSCGKPVELDEQGFKVTDFCSDQCRDARAGAKTINQEKKCATIGCDRLRYIDYDYCSPAHRGVVSLQHVVRGSGRVASAGVELSDAEIALIMAKRQENAKSSMGAT
jgi:endogenous inhibitor of DNA gyrase (YacG/DUF329 family)